MANSVYIKTIDPITFEYQDYSQSDENLITNFNLEADFNPDVDYVSAFIYDLNNNIVKSDEVLYNSYQIWDNEIYVDPEFDVSQYSDEGSYNIVYNFLTNEVNSSADRKYFISQISPNRTELRLDTTAIPDLEVVTAAAVFQLKQSGAVGIFRDFYLNFGNNQLIIANNFQLDNSDPTNPTLLIKLYEPLPGAFTFKSECSIVTAIADSVAFNVNIEPNYQYTFQAPQIAGPNFNLNIKDQINNSTDYVNYQSLTSQSYGTGSSNLHYQINSILAERGIEINVDYSDFNNFIYFSSAQTRLENFYYKLSLIETYQYSASLTDGTGSGYISSSQNIWNEKINEIITTFDGYDYHLYYNSGSTSWPKTNSTYPYTNASTTNPGIGYTWFTSQSAVALSFDEDNNNSLINAVPSYLREDEDNAEFELFVEMLGEMFDNIWIYYQDVTQKWNADNRLQYGVSKDLVADILRDLGLKIYQSNFSSTDLYLAFLGVTPEGNQFPFPYITGSYPVPTGYEYIDTKISASNEAVPLEDVQKSFYKRLYHNLPFLLKKKGTTTGLQNLLTTYGVPDTILRVAEFGGKDKIETNDWDYWQHKYNNAYTSNAASNYVATPFTLNSAWNNNYLTQSAETVAFRIKPSGLNYAQLNNTQNIFIASGSVKSAYIDLIYPYSSLTSGSYSGSIPGPESASYAYLNFYPDHGSPNLSASVYLPFLDGGWWTVAVTYTGSNGFNLYAANNIYDGDDGSTIGWIASSSVTADLTVWESSISASFHSDKGNQFPNGGRFFSGSLQEIRYYSKAIDIASFKDFVMNPDSIKFNDVNGASNYLAFRAALGGELYTGSTSIHPKVTGSWTTTQSFANNSSFTINNGEWKTNKEYIFLRQPAVGIKNIISNKIQVVDMNLPSGDTLSQYISIQQQNTASLFTENSTYTEVAFSPQNEINDDIMGQLGFVNMGDYIGDPRQRFQRKDYYPDLNLLRNNYFEKYTHNYNIFEYINLIKYFDNSLFKMIKDFTPARASLASGVVVKQTILERSKYPQPLVTASQHEYTGSIDTSFIEGGPGGSMPNLARGGITEVEILDGGFGYTGSVSLYPITITGGFGDGAVLTPVLTQYYTLAQGTELKNSITQNSSDATTGGDFVFTNQNGSPVTIRITIGGGGDVTSAEVRTATNVNLGFAPGDIITISTSDIGGSTDVLIELQPADLGGVYDGFVSSVEINYPGQNYQSFPTLLITGTTGSDAQLQVTELNNSIVTQTWDGNIVTPYGLAPFTQSDAVEFYNGEFSGSEFVVSNGELNSANTVKVVDTTLLQYESTGSQTGIISGSQPQAGQYFWSTGSIDGLYDGKAGLQYLYINEVDENGVNVLQALQNLNPGDQLRFTIKFDIPGTV